MVSLNGYGVPDLSNHCFITARVVETGRDVANGGERNAASGLLTTVFGGYVALLTPKKALVNALLVGVLTLALNLGLWFGTDIGYGIEFPLMLIAAALLTVPAALLGGWLYLRQHATA